MAKWRYDPVLTVVPAWVWDNINDPLVDIWLDELYASDRKRWEQVIIEIISTPTRGVPGG